MIKVNIICVGKPKERYLQAGLDDFCKRLSPYAKLQIIGIRSKDIPPKLTEQQAIRTKEEETLRVLSRVKPNSYTFALDLRGEHLSSEEFADTLQQLMVSGKSEFNFLVGGPLGFHDIVLTRSNHVLSLSRLTFPHHFVPLIIAEQLYRAFRIMEGAPYHR
jgi:23S rRNA (pseudouridine1915-N3)-methyltransferase